MKISCELTTCSESIESLEAMLSEDRSKQAKLCVELRQLGLTWTTIAAISGLSESRVRQIVNGNGHKGAASERGRVK